MTSKITAKQKTQIIQRNKTGNIPVIKMALEDVLEDLADTDTRLTRSQIWDLVRKYNKSIQNTDEFYILFNHVFDVFRRKTCRRFNPVLNKDMVRNVFYAQHLPSMEKVYAYVDNMKTWQDWEYVIEPRKRQIDADQAKNDDNITWQKQFTKPGATNAQP